MTKKLKPLKLGRNKDMPKCNCSNVYCSCEIKSAVEWLNKEIRTNETCESLEKGISDKWIHKGSVLALIKEAFEDVMKND